MKIIVTGACGFIGSHVAEYLTAAGHTVLGIDNLSTGKRENLQKGIEFANLDITDYYMIVGEFKDFEPEAVIHLAAQPAISTSWEQPIRDAHNNIMGTLAVIRACKEAEVRRIVFSSTSAVYDEKYDGTLYPGSPIHPTTPYGISKFTAEQYLKTLVPDISTILRFGNVYGPRQVPLGENQVIPLMIRHLVNTLDGKECPFFIHGSGEQRRDFVYVLDVADAIKKAIASENIGTFNIASGEGASVNHVAYLLSNLAQITGYVWEHDDKVDHRDIEMSIDHTTKTIDWEPETVLVAGLEHTYNWWKRTQS